MTMKDKRQAKNLKVETKWTYVGKPSPQFAKLVSLLLRANNGGRDGDRKEGIDGTERQDTGLL